MAFPFLFTFTILLHISLSSANSFVPLPDRVDNGFKTYIVHVKHNFCAQSDTEAREDWYRSFLPATIQLTKEPERLIHSYHNVLSGFAARLTEDEVKAMEVMEGFVSARPERVLHLKTTHTPNFLGLFPQMGVWKDSNFGNGTIIGVMDSGVLPTHPSFNDEGMPPPPAKWKGRCEFNGPHCNNKLIGARNLVKESFNDLDGHGTHTASTAAGAFVKDAEALGNAFGTAVGMAPYAHLAIYKVCSLDDCTETDVLAGLDHAVEDGVDVLSLSIGEDPVPFHENTISIGSFRAMQKGIFVSCAAGNGGPWKSSVDNDAPWILTVGASTIDRSIRATAKLGNGQEFDGESLFQPKYFPATLLPLVYAGANGKADSALCREGSLKGMDVKGKVVVCDQGGGIGRIEKGKEVKDAGGAAMIIRNDEAHAFSTEADAHVLPASHVSFADGLEIMGYINSSSIPTATIIFKGTVIGRSSAPQVTAFSSRGPSIASPGILKPDIIGPGVNILAAWPFPLDNTSSRRLTFNIMSGTSMSCPHLSGIASLLKSSHPDWSPAAIKSAMMTTADLYNLKEKSILDQDLYPADLFATGSGHVNPSRANNPGLVYDIQPDDYIPYLCGLGYTDDQVTILTHRAITCANITSIPEGQLNYPSLSVKLGPRQIFTRTLTNVGHANSFYTLDIVAPHGVDVNVKPDKLHFSEINQKLTYTVTFTRTTSTGLSSFSHGFLKWVSLKHFVRTPISVTFG